MTDQRVMPPVLTTQEALDNPPPVELKTLIYMDGDEHTACRKLGLAQFKPAGLDRLPYPLHVILKIFGLPEALGMMILSAAIGRRTRTAEGCSSVRDVLTTSSASTGTTTAAG